MSQFIRPSPDWTAKCYVVGFVLIMASLYIINNIASTEYSLLMFIGAGILASLLFLFGAMCVAAAF